MNPEYNLLLNIYSIIILLVVILYSKRHHDIRILHNYVFIWIATVALLLLCFDILGRFDGLSTPFHPILNQVGNFMLYLLGPLLPMLWILYLHLQTGYEKEVTAKLIRIFAVMLGFNTALCFISLFTGWIYYIDEMNIYHRGDYYLIPIGLDFALVIAATIHLVSSWNKMDHRRFCNLIVFPLVPAVGMVVQMLFYQVPIVMNTIALAILIIFLNIQNLDSYMDNLTGIYNRKKLDRYMGDRHAEPSTQRPFGGILIDIDDFKLINDSRGHARGDQVLREIAQLLKSCLRDRDFIARYGGDEFFIVVDTDNHEVLQDILRRIDAKLEQANLLESFGHPVNLSMGYAIYEPDSGMTVAEFQHNIDSKMYKIKNLRKRGA